MDTDPEARESLADKIDDALQTWSRTDEKDEAACYPVADAVLAWMAERGYSKRREVDTEALSPIREWRGWFTGGEAPSLSEWRELDRRIEALTAGYSKQHPPAADGWADLANLQAQVNAASRQLQADAQWLQEWIENAEAGGVDAKDLELLREHAALGAVRPAPEIAPFIRTCTEADLAKHEPEPTEGETR
jgi:hypothetical protein